MTSANELLGSPAKPLAETRNILLDRFFYDVESLSDEDHQTLSAAPDQEGAIIVVSPKSTNKKIRYYESATEMLKKERDTINGIALAGVGSSIVGTAALARNVADTYGFDVAGIISGYGVSDLIAEAMGGWFFYGYVDRFRHTVSVLIEKAARFLPVSAVHSTKDSVKITYEYRDRSIPRQLDSGTLLDVLSARPKNLKILVGHSKGALLMDYVLEEFVRRMGPTHQYYDDLYVVTVSAVVGIPENFIKKSQIIGALDWFGGINSLPDLLFDRDPVTRPKFIHSAWHSLKVKNNPYKLDLVDALGTHVSLQ